MIAPAVATCRRNLHPPPTPPLTTYTRGKLFLIKSQPCHSEEEVGWVIDHS